MTKIGKIIFNFVVIAAATASIGAAVGTTIKALFPLQVYACDFRLISAATCNLPMAAHTIRITPTPAEVDRERRSARRDRIISCELEKTAKRRNGELVLARKCWDEGVTSLARISSR